uniref:Uncharacterized protein n=1 Tax=Arion vulgaris TaxID=1028688 RepID=A0A0B7AT62_9EUPU
MYVLSPLGNLEYQPGPLLIHFLQQPYLQVYQRVHFSYTGMSLHKDKTYLDLFSDFNHCLQT